MSEIARRHHREVVAVFGKRARIGKRSQRLSAKGAQLRMTDAEIVSNLMRCHVHAGIVAGDGARRNEGSGCVECAAGRGDRATAYVRVARPSTAENIGEHEEN